MLFPVEALAGWIVAACVVVLLVRLWRRLSVLWCGLGVIAAGAIYYPAVMANRLPNYYAIREFLASSTAIGGGLVIVGVAGFRLLSSTLAEPDQRERT